MWVSMSLHDINQPWFNWMALVNGEQPKNIEVFFAMEVQC